MLLPGSGPAEIRTRDLLDRERKLYRSATQAARTILCLAVLIEHRLVTDKGPYLIVGKGKAMHFTLGTLIDRGNY